MQQGTEKPAEKIILSAMQLGHLEFILRSNMVYAVQRAGKPHPAVIVYNFRAASGNYQDNIREVDL